MKNNIFFLSLLFTINTFALEHNFLTNNTFSIKNEKPYQESIIKTDEKSVNNIINKRFIKKFDIYIVEKKTAPIQKLFNPEIKTRTSNFKTIDIEDLKIYAIIVRTDSNNNIKNYILEKIHTQKRINKLKQSPYNLLFKLDLNNNLIHIINNNTSIKIDEKIKIKSNKREIILEKSKN